MTGLIKGIIFIILLAFFLLSGYFEKFIDALTVFVEKVNNFFLYFYNVDPIFGTIAVLFASVLIFYFIYSYKD